MLEAIQLVSTILIGTLVAGVSAVIGGTLASVLLGSN